MPLENKNDQDKLFQLIGEMLNGDFMKWLRECPLDDPKLVATMAVLGLRLYHHRLENNGYVPRAIYPHTLTIGSPYPCTEVVVQVMGGDLDGNKIVGYALKQRDPKSEQGWAGLYQIPGVAVRLTDNPKDIWKRLSEEIFGDPDLLDPLWLEPLGFVLYDEAPVRLTMAPTMVYLLKISREDFGRLDVNGKWMLSHFANEEDIIPYHRKTLLWVMEGPGRDKMVRF